MQKSSGILIPDPWQQEAIEALKNGKDVILNAPTGAGKTLVFEWLIEKRLIKGKSIYTVPTRALANDKLLEWKRKKWDVGLCTGDRSINLDAPIVVATLETQKRNILHGNGPRLLVIDEYQMLNDSDRGLNYELTIATAPANTQLLLMSGSVANPNDVKAWLQRNDRAAVTVEHLKRPVPLEEIQLESLKGYVPKQAKGYWGRNILKALSCDLGPILVFAPKRNVSESLAREIADSIECKNPLILDENQRRLAKQCNMSSMLIQGVAYHHSGLSYEQRSQLIEPLAKEGKLKVVVATTGLGLALTFR